MEINDWLVISMFVTFILLLFSGLPIYIVLVGTGVLFTGLGLLADQYWEAYTGLDYLALGPMVNRLFDMMSNGVLVALPLFIFMGLMLDRSDVAKKLMTSMQELLGTLRGGLPLTVVVMGVLLAVSTGIIGASVVLLGMLSLPTMLQQNYSKELAVGPVCSAGCLGILIPPSIMLVLMADQLSLSVGDLFMGAVFPGIILAGFYGGHIVIYSLLKPENVPLSSERKKLSWTVVWQLLKTIIPPLLLIFAVLGSIFCGVATPTEASGVGALGATLLALWNKKLDIKIFKGVCQDTTRTSGLIFAIFMGANCFSLVFRELGGDEFIAGPLGELSLGPYGLLFFILGLVFLLGFFLGWIEITLIIFPLLAPAIVQAGFFVDGHGVLDEPILLWFTLLVAMTLQTSFLTPPVGLALFYLKGIAPKEITLTHLYRGVIPFICLQLLALVVVILFPKLVTWLPSVAYY